VGADGSTSITTGETFLGQTKDSNLLPLDFLFGQRQNATFVLRLLELVDTGAFHKR
jgi:hypothetical protein